MRLKTHRSGFTLIELASAMAVLAIGVFAIITSFHYGLEKVRAIKEMHTAQSVAQNQLERLRTLPFDELAEEDHTVLPPLAALDTLVRARAERTVRAYGDPGLRLREVEVRVSWVGDGGRPMHASALTLIGDKGGPAK